MNTKPAATKLQQSLPMALTYSRIFIAPVVMAILFIPWAGAGWTAAIVFILASATDWFDGSLARRYGVESTAGKLMDPIADKILVLGAIIMLLAMGRVDPVMVFLLLARDTLIGGIRSVAAANQVVIAAKPFGKWKTAMQMIGIPCLMVYDPLWDTIPLARIGYVCLWVSVVLSLISGAQYSLGYFKSRP